MKKIIAILFLIFSPACFSFELKLSCDVQSTYTYSTGTVERNSGKALVEVREQRLGKLITISSGIDVVNDLSASTYQLENRSSDDFSDSNKWDIRTVVNRGNLTSITRIIIDRNSGIIIIDRVFNNNGRATNTQVSGSCNKIDTSTRKF